MNSESELEYWTKRDCLDAMQLFVDYYMKGDDKERWTVLIEKCVAEDRFPPGKGFLYDIDKAIKTSWKPNMKNRSQLYMKICEFCI